MLSSGGKSGGVDLEVGTAVCPSTSLAARMASLHRIGLTIKLPVSVPPPPVPPLLLLLLLPPPLLPPLPMLLLSPQ